MGTGSLEKIHPAPSQTDDTGRVSIIHNILPWVVLLGCWKIKLHFSSVQSAGKAGRRVDRSVLEALLPLLPTTGLQGGCPDCCCALYLFNVLRPGVSGPARRWLSRAKCTFAKDLINKLIQCFPNRSLFTSGRWGWRWHGFPFKMTLIRDGLPAEQWGS